MKIIFFGLGQIGKRHLKLLQKHFDFNIYAFRSGKGHAKNESFENIIEINTWNEVDLIKPDIAFITNPTYLHIETALMCARRRIKLFIEKPIGHNIKLLDELLLVCTNLTTYVAYPMRYIPSITGIAKEFSPKDILHAQFICSTYLPNWRSYSTYSSYKDRGGGAILDLSHEIDLSTFLCGDIINIQGTYGKRSNVTCDAEDYADLIIKHEHGLTSNIHLDLFSHETRSLSIQTEYNNYKYPLVVDNSVYLKQLQYFFDHIGDIRMMNNIHDASDMFRKVIQWKESQVD